MVWLKHIYQGGGIEKDVLLTHPTLHYGFSLLLHWGLKAILSVRFRYGFYFNSDLVWYSVKTR